MTCSVARSKVSPFDSRSVRTARIAAGVSLAVDVVVPLMSTGVDLYRCSDGTKSFWSTDERDEQGVVVRNGAEQPGETSVGTG